MADAGVAALVSRQWMRAAGLCLGFAPVLSMALHNWIYGHVFVPLSANAAHPDVLVMPPVGLRYGAARTHHAEFQWRISRARTDANSPLAVRTRGSYATVPMNAGGVAVLLYVLLRGRGFDPWLRLIAAARSLSTPSRCFMSRRRAITISLGFSPCSWSSPGCTNAASTGFRAATRISARHRRGAVLLAACFRPVAAGSNIRV